MFKKKPIVATALLLTIIAHSVDLLSVNKNLSLEKKLEQIKLSIWQKKIGIKKPTKKKCTKKCMKRAIKFRDPIPLIFSGKDFLNTPNLGQEIDFFNRDFKILINTAKNWDHDFSKTKKFEKLFSDEPWEVTKNKKLKKHKKKVSDLMKYTIKHCVNHRIYKNKYYWQTIEKKLNAMRCLHLICSHSSGLQALKNEAKKENKHLLMLFKEITGYWQCKDSNLTINNSTFHAVQNILQDIIISANPKAKGTYLGSSLNFGKLNKNLRNKILMLNCTNRTEKIKTIKKILAVNKKIKKT